MTDADRAALKAIDDLLSEAQLVLRYGYHDRLSRAVAQARDRLSALIAAGLSEAPAPQEKK